ncbi:hypothetical protein GE21DRAFT_4988 [Neurospora crassa]|uniref:Uncharacterized protein n=1 Tax=Neurospora crassa (strain ATCC 24698 / 74-OR23-1A / CBS 708.71 / DSM 1257 / FGSC 987) TaxID=367110 RepID=Q7S3N6_NEUCR|nr:hypothetical protein NCU08207 [Neurospora crassa OR74A]EAA30061.1 hypothetical protein NCU08207 [Neurospora crassa OR74A]KHE86453.1 hypothetical protein GE21DRAFT_4988 [Neurospora crassa]|eukprot:XP_959297.1 hypothetical protein NCU08207 [Neurospora crassa OR74A]
MSLTTPVLPRMGICHRSFFFSCPHQCSSLRSEFNIVTPAYHFAYHIVQVRPGAGGCEVLFVLDDHVVPPDLPREFDVLVNIRPDPDSDTSDISPRRRDREASSSSESSSSEDDGPPQEPWLINQQKRGGYVILKSGTRRYDEWCGLDSNRAYFLEGYQPNWDQSKPFRCPIVNCHLAFEFGRDTSLIQRQTRYEFVDPLFIGQLSL